MTNMMYDDLIEVDLRITKEEDMHLPTFDNTKLTAINTCPRWGIIRYHQHKRMPGTSRAMALEAGSACHELFSAVRLIELKHQGLYDHFIYKGQQLFGEQRFEQMLYYINIDKDDNENSIRNFCLEALYTSGFYDDPEDKRRTMTNLEEACLAYMDRYRWYKYPIYVKDINDPKSFVGIEVPVDIVVSLTYKNRPKREYRFTGKIDGITHKGDSIIIDENKTASRLNDAWRESFHVSHQPTGYMIATSVITGESCNEARVHGLSIPQPKYSQDNGHAVLDIERTIEQFHQWFQWFDHTTQLFEVYKDDPVNAPMYTHSCNRYNRPCSFIPLCVETYDVRKSILENEMQHDEWTPLDVVEVTDAN